MKAKEGSAEDWQGSHERIEGQYPVPMGIVLKQGLHSFWSVAKYPIHQCFPRYILSKNHLEALFWFGFSCSCGTWKFAFFSKLIGDVDIVHLQITLAIQAKCPLVAHISLIIILGQPYGGTTWTPTQNLPAIRSSASWWPPTVGAFRICLGFQTETSSSLDNI